MTADSTVPASGVFNPAASPDQGSSHHRSRHSRNLRGSDPFFVMPDKMTKLQDESVPKQDKSQGHDESLPFLVELILTPINMVSFLISLFMVDRQQRQWRIEQHTSGPQSIWSRWTNWSWLHPEPYQDSTTGAWTRSSSAAAQVPSDGAFAGWYARKNHRAIAKLEFGDAFALRKRVIVAILLWSLVFSILAAYGIRWLYSWAVH